MKQKFSLKEKIISHLGGQNLKEICTYIFLYVLNKLCKVRILYIINLSVENIKKNFHPSSFFVGRKLRPLEIKKFEYNTQRLSEDFIHYVHTIGDICYVFTDKKKIINYCWYSGKPSAIDDYHIIHFNPDYLYAYNAYTEEEYRGKRLHGLGMAQMVQVAHYEMQKNGLIGFIDIQNYKSMRSCERLGYKKKGIVFLIEVFGKKFSYATQGCGFCGLSIEILDKPFIFGEKLTSETVS